MGKLAIFSLLWWITGSPIVALVVLLVLAYALDRRFVGLTPSIIKPIRRRRRLAWLFAQLRLNPHDVSVKLDAAHLLIEMGRYGKALPLLEEAWPRMEESPDVQYDIGLCRLKLGELEQGRAMILDSVAKLPRVRYGEPYLRLAEAFASREPEEAIRYLERFREVQSSSSEALYRLGRLYTQLGRRPQAAAAYREALDTYRALPRYLRRTERRWGLLAWIRLLSAG